MTKLILVIDDDREVHRIFGAVLGGAGYEVHAAFDSMQGTMMVRQLKPRLTILDIRMPAGGGGAVYDRIQNLSFGATMQVLIYSAMPEAQIRSMIEGIENVRVVSKPAAPAALLQAVQELIGPS